VLVRVVERLRHLDRDLDRLRDPELCLAIQLVADRFAFDIGHDVVEESVRLAGVEQRQDVWVAQRRRGLDLLHEPLGAEHGGELRAQHLDGDLAVVFEVLGQIDGSHAALAELTLDAVAIGEGGREAGPSVAHRALSEQARRHPPRSCRSRRPETPGHARSDGSSVAGDQ